MMPTSIGSYRILRVLGEGGMGTVYVGEHHVLGRQAAIKVLLPALSARADVVQRFFNEARAATAIRDPGIVAVFDFGHDAGGAYLVMELLDGEPLDTRLARCGRLAPDDAIRIARQVTATLGAAHARGIVHRDLKPENIFLVPDPEVVGGERAKILDFGIAKLAAEPNVAPRTQIGAIMGTPAYMSPEQCRGSNSVDARSDIYAVGCVLFHLLVGQPPFVGEGVGDVLVKQVHEPAPRVASCGLRIPEALERLVARCLAKRPEERFQTAGELVAALDELRKASVPPPPSASSSMPLPATILAPMPTTLGASSGSRVQGPTPPRRRWLAPAIAVALLVAAGVWMLGRDREAAIAPAIVIATPPPAVVRAPTTIDAGVDAPVDAPADARLDAAPPDVAPVAPRPRSKRSPSNPIPDPCDRDGDGIPETRC